MQTRSIDRLLLCISNCLIFSACLHDLFVVKYRTDIHLISRWLLIIVVIFYIILFFLTRVSSYLFSKTFIFSTSLLLSFCLSLSTFTLITNTVSSTTNFVLFNFLLILSIICSFLSNLIHLLNNTTFYFIHYNELAELIGYCFGLYITAQSISVYYLLLSLFLLIITLRLRAFHGFILLLFNLGYFYNYYTPYSYIACFCFLVRLIGRPIIELYFISLTSLERWILLLHLSSSYRVLFQRFMILIYCLLPLHSIYIIGQTVRFHNEWFIIVPVFIISVAIWFIFRSLTCSLLWMLSNKLIDCYLTMVQANNADEHHKISFTKLMASRGIRYFGLIAWPMLVCSTILTCFISLLHYDTCTTYSLVLFLLTIDFECLVLALVKQLTSIVGGSCVGYALVEPAVETRDNGLFSGSRNVQILSQQDAYESSQRCTNILNGLERFMANNLIDIFGCDYSSSGVSMNFIDNKLKTFFARRTDDGRHYDTYIFYFSGPTCDNGDIILADNQKITLNLLFQWWCENESSSSSRLILVFDTYHSHKWLKQIRCQTFNNTCKPGVYIVLQTFTQQKKMPKLIELGQVHLGIFTEIWLKLNMTDETSKTSHDSNASWRANHLEPKCSFSYYYPEFNFRQPTSVDVDTYLNEHLFLKRLHFIYHLLTYIPSLFIYPFLYIFNCIKRWRFHLLAPRVIDTYHGFKLFVR
ncbi:unnamed protein product [Rotaria magnacalcarata]|uniref:Transmembrane protein 168 n=1 Tax=Rotaria magnacalcarata TaxID=392030 RepID=A0A816E4Q6_9BILA|nr:unnamed protein product [Rotaria magnacalcarata]CAF1643003.1 unnamed protein product [Rotaria magnacalcarata]CAF2080518.1 unnamed protein product [Rotaria magnacalcarata]CAF2087544.1 unnamed protein product [Rotaria magnacalcarata]CAF3806710.1 unnamed protein product [Rotaria magnacalcarata]